MDPFLTGHSVIMDDDILDVSKDIISAFYTKVDNGIYLAFA